MGILGAQRRHHRPPAGLAFTRMGKKQADLSRLPSRPADGNSPSIGTCSSRQGRRRRAPGAAASPAPCLDNRVPSQRRRPGSWRAGVPVPPSVDAGRCRTGSNPPPVAPHLHDARPPPLQPRCGADMPVVARHTPLQPLHSTAASEPSMQQLPADGWTHALVRPQAGLALPPANRRPKRGAAGPAEAEPPKQAAKCANTPPSSPARSQLSPGMVPCRTSRSALPLRALRAAAAGAAGGLRAARGDRERQGDGRAREAWPPVRHGRDRLARAALGRAKRAPRRAAAPSLLVRGRPARSARLRRLG